MCDKNLVFPAIIQKDGQGYMVSFPDLAGCFSDGQNLVEAYLNARDALALYLHELEEIPTPSDVEKICVENGGRVMLVTPDEQDNIEYADSLDITEILQKAIEKKGYSQYKVAKILGLSESYISFIVSGKRVPSTAVAQKLASLLDIDWRIFYPVSSNF